MTVMFARHSSTIIKLLPSVARSRQPVPKCRQRLVWLTYRAALGCFELSAGNAFSPHFRLQNELLSVHDQETPKEKSITMLRRIADVVAHRVDDGHPPNIR